MDGLTGRQKKALEVIKTLIADKGYSPTHSEIAFEMDVFTNCAYGHIAALKKKGFISFLDGIPRTIRVITK